MAFPVVEARAESSVTSPGTSHPVTKPTGTAAGDVWVIFFGHPLACTLDALAGWTELVDTNSANGEKWLVRKCDGTEDATVTFTSSASTKSAHLCWRISGAVDLATQAPELSTVATGTSTTPDATTCTPTGGAKDYLWITAAVTAGEEADDDTWGGAAPSGFANAIYKTTGTTGIVANNCSAEAADQQLNAASLDAAAWGANAQSLAWRAWTLAIHPPAAGQTVAVGQATETDTAQTTIPLRIKTTTQAISTEVGQVVSPVRIHAFSQSVETDAAGVVTPALEGGQDVQVAQALETDAADASTPLRVYTTGQAEETDQGFGLTGLKSRSVAQVTETDEAQAVTRLKVLTLGQSEETEVAQALTVEHRATVGQASELDEAFGIAAPGRVPVNQAQETDEARQVTAPRLVDVVMAEETDVANPVAIVGRIGTGVFRGPSRVRIRVGHNEVT
jgi:hypothetical protein